jgi:hypothetical protein
VVIGLGVSALEAISVRGLLGKGFEFGMVAVASSPVERAGEAAFGGERAFRLSLACDWSGGAEEGSTSIITFSADALSAEPATTKAAAEVGDEDTASFFKRFDSRRDM